MKCSGACGVRSHSRTEVAADARHHRQPRLDVPPSLKPAWAWSMRQGIGVQQPSRPLYSGQKAMPGGSTRSSGRPARPGQSEFIALIQQAPRSENSIAITRRMKSLGACRPFQRLSTRTESWLPTVQQGQPPVCPAAAASSNSAAWRRRSA